MISNPEIRATDPEMAHRDVLVDLCKDELAAVETYEKALGLSALRPHASILSRCYTAHRNNATELGQRIIALGGEAPTSVGVWGTLLPALTGAAAAVSEKLAIGLLEESEDRGVKRYRDAFDELDPVSREFLVARVLPSQNMSHAAMSTLKHTLDG